MQRTDVVDTLANLSRVRRLYLRQRNSLNLAMLGMTRSELGFDNRKLKDKKEMKKIEKSNKPIKTQSTRIVTALVSNNTSKLKDMDVDIFNHIQMLATGFLDALDSLEETKERLEKQIVSAAKQLPEAEWWNSHIGLGYMGFGLLIGEAGNLSRFEKVSQLWKRMGLAVINGERQRKDDRPETVIPPIFY